jgi:exosortase A
MRLSLRRPSTVVAAGPASWIAPAVCLGLATLALGGVFHADVVGAYSVWLTSTAYNHCFLILPVAAYLAWVRRDVLKGMRAQPDFRVLLLLLPLSLLWLVAAMLSVLEAQQILVVTMFQVIAFAVLGAGIYRAMLAPLLYLYFLVPSGYFLVPYLQDFTAWFTVMGLQLVHIPVFWDGTIIQIPAGVFVVAEACAGLRFLIASVAFGVFFAALMYRSPMRWIIFVALSVIVPIIANGFRAFGLLVLAQMSGSAAMIMADHIIYGWGFFTFVTFVLILIGRALADGEDDADAVGRLPEYQGAAPQPWKTALAAILGLSLAAAGPAYAQLLGWRAAAVDLAVAPAPGVGASWRPTNWDAGWKPAIIAPDRDSFEAFTDGGTRVARYVGLYLVAGLHNNLGRGQNQIADFERWHLIGGGRTHARIAGKDVVVDVTKIEQSGRKLLLWDFYVVDDEVIAGRAEAKLRQLRGLFSKQSPIAAFVAIAADNSDPAHPADAVLARFLDEMSPLGAYFETLAKSR